MAERLADKGDTFGRVIGEIEVPERAGFHPLCAGAGFASTTPAENQPGAPGFAVVCRARRQLIVAGGEQPVVVETDDVRQRNVLEVERGEAIIQILWILL